MGAQGRNSAATSRPLSSCAMVPPCRHPVDHGPERKKPIGKYYFTEDALKHDLAALKKGEVYGRDDFYRRVKAWYEAEIDRLLHEQMVKEDESHIKTAETASDDLPQPNTALAKPPSRVQPARAAKQKAAEQAFAVKQFATRKRKHTEDSAQHIPKPETKGDYTLASYDWAQFLSGNREEHSRSPWSYIQFQGLDVAYFCMRLERAVQAKVDEILSNQTPPPPQSQEEAPNVASISMTADINRRTSKEGMPPPSNTAPLPLPRRPQPLQLHPPTPKYRCALSSHLSYHPPIPFSPRAALAPGEDWRPPPLDNNTPGSKASPAKGVGTIMSGWAAAEIRRREELNRRAAAAAAAAAAANEIGMDMDMDVDMAGVPEAEMRLVPRLGGGGLSIRGRRVCWWRI